jgi:septation ring formation regulator EzrA
MNDDDLEDVRYRLTKIKEQFECLIDEVQKETPDRQLVKNKYGVLKVKLRSDSEKYKTIKGQANASGSESAFYYPAVTEALLELKVKIDAPPSDKMLQCLIGGEDYVTYYLSQINT